MAQESPNRLAEWLLVIREQVPVIRQRFEDWLAAVREEPVLIWETTAVRCSAYAAAGLLLVWLTIGLVGMLTPPPAANARPTATTADFHVLCADTACGHHFVVHRKFGFRGFPVSCPKCQKETGVRARRCSSQSCKGRWVAPRRADGTLSCPVCGGRFD